MFIGRDKESWIETLTSSIVCNCDNPQKFSAERRRKHNAIVDHVFGNSKKIY